MIKSILILSAWVLPSLAEARWAHLEDVTQRVRRYERHIEFDGRRAIHFTRIDIEVLKDGGRDAGTFRVQYNPETTRLKLKSAFTVNGSKKHRPRPDSIVDKPKQVSTQGFDEVRELVVSFPQVQVGSRLVLELEQVEVKFPLKVWSETWQPTTGAQYDRVDIKIDSKVPLFWHLNDPRQSFDFTVSQAGNRWVYQLKNRRSLIEEVLEEENAYLPRAQISWLVVSAAETYPAYFAHVLPDYEAVLNAPLPASYIPLVNAVRGPDDFATRVNKIIKGLHDRLRYMGDWRGVRGTHVPRPLTTVAKSGSGDCKDFAAALVAILRKGGVAASVAVVWSEVGYAPDLPPVPVGDFFNHAIVHVSVDGQDYWLDPTDPRVFAQGIPPHLLDREAVVLERSQPRLARIPSSGRLPFRLETRVDWPVTRAGLNTAEVEMLLKGGMGYHLAGLTEFQSQESVGRTLAQTLFSEPEVMTVNLKPLDFSDRITREHEIRGTVEIEPLWVQTSVGRGLALHNVGHVDRIARVNLTNRVSGLALGSPQDHEQNWKLRNFRLKGDQLRGCRISSPWFEFEREVSQRRSELHVRDRYRSLRRYVAAEFLRSPEFQQMRSQLKDCTQNVVFVSRE